MSMVLVGKELREEKAMNEIISFFIAYYEGAKWFFHLIKILLWDNPVYFYHTNNWILFIIYVIYFGKLIRSTFWNTLDWEYLFRKDFGGPKGFFIFIEWFVIIIGPIALFYHKLWLPYPEFWISVQKFLTWIYVDGLTASWHFHWIAGVAYFLFVDLCFGAFWPIHLTYMIHGEAPFVGYTNTVNRESLAQHNQFMQLVNIEKAITRIGKK